MNLYRAFIHLEIYGFAEPHTEYLHEVFLTKGKYDLQLYPTQKGVDLDLHIKDKHEETIFMDDTADPGASAWLTIYEEGVFHFYVKAYDAAKYVISIQEIKEVIEQK